MDLYRGEIRAVGFDFAVRGWALCDGRLLLIRDQTALFSLFGATYGGDGRETFALPDLRGRSPLHKGHHRLGEVGTTRSIGSDQSSVQEASRVEGGTLAVTFMISLYGWFPTFDEQASANYLKEQIPRWRSRDDELPLIAEGRLFSFERAPNGW